MKVILEFAGMKSDPIEWPDQTPPVITMALRNSNSFFASRYTFENNPRIIKHGYAKFEWTGLYMDNAKIYSLIDFERGN